MVRANYFFIAIMMLWRVVSCALRVFICKLCSMRILGVFDPDQSAWASLGGAVHGPDSCFVASLFLSSVREKETSHWGFGIAYASSIFVS